MNLVSLEPVWRPQNQQQGFRCLLEAFSYPGRIFDLSDMLAESRAELGILACLVDDQVSYADPDGLIDSRERRLLGTACIEPEAADYVVHNAALPPADAYTPKLGALYRPDSAATLLLSGASVGMGAFTLKLEGPGIQTTAELRLDGFDPQWFARREGWVSNFPQGVDILLCDRRRVAALPRTCRVTIG